MSLISYTTFSALFGAYLLNRALYKYFFNATRTLPRLSEMLAQYKTKQSFSQRFLPAFLKKPQKDSLYEFHCNLDEKGQLNSPVSLHWSPMFNYLDENKQSLSFVYSGVYYPKNKRIDVLNLTQLVEYQEDISNTRFKSVDKENMMELVRCLIYSNISTLKVFGPKVSVEFEYKMLKGDDSDSFDISLKILDLKTISQKKSILAGMLGKKENREPGQYGQLSIVDELVVGQKGCSYYFFVINDKGLSVYTPVASAEYSSAHRIPFENLLEVVCNKKVVEKVITPELLQRSRLIEVLVLPNQWQLHGLNKIKTGELSLSVENAYKDNYFLESLSKAMNDIQYALTDPTPLKQHFEKIYI